MTLERDLKAALLLAAPREIPSLRLFNRPVMRVKLPGDRTVATGIRGQADLYGIARGGLHIELELKTAEGRLTSQQLTWQRFCLEWSIPHLVLRAQDGETTQETVKRWCDKINAELSRRWDEQQR